MSNPYLTTLREDPKIIVVWAVATTGVAILIRLCLRYVSVLRQARGVPTIHCGLETFESPFRSILPHIPFIFPARAFTIDQPFKKYADAKTDLIAITQLSSTYAIYTTASPDLAATIFSKPNIFLKATEAFRYKSADGIFGKNIVTAQNGAEHRRHLNVIKGCFEEETMRAVWAAAEQCADIMVQGLEVEEGGVVRDWGSAMVKYTLLILGKAGFGQDWPWHSPAAGSGGDNLADAFDTFERTIVAQTVFPLWMLLWSPIPAMREWGEAQRSIHHFIDSVNNAQLPVSSSEKPGDANIIEALIHAQASSVGSDKLTRKEVYANIMMFIFAGHETTAHALTFLIAFIIADSEVQDKMHAEIIQTDDCITETVRLRDSIQYMSKRTSEDVTVIYRTWTDDEHDPISRTHTINAGSRVIVDSPACSVNPTTHSDPTAFRPERWGELDADGNSADRRNIFTGFSQGQRACIGKRFAEVEMLSFLNTFIRRYRIEPVYLPGETKEQMVQRYLKCTERITPGSGVWDIKLVKRGP